MLVSAAYTITFSCGTRACTGMETRDQRSVNCAPTVALAGRRRRSATLHDDDTRMNNGDADSMGRVLSLAPARARRCAEWLAVIQTQDFVCHFLSPFAAVFVVLSREFGCAIAHKWPKAVSQATDGQEWGTRFPDRWTADQARRI